ncbi:MAG: alpha/beta hydrolase [Flavobacteriales bacterium]|nr:alpha/beta hydrolase [Flavobacteriales bacterium]
MKKKSIYLMPGMAASPKIFELIKFPEQFDIHNLFWIPPFKNEKLSDYALRMSKKINVKKPILIGVSFGGLLVQEISKIIECEKLIIISSIKSKSELPIHMKMANRTKVHNLLPLEWIKNIENLVLFVFGDLIKTKINLYEKYLSERDPEYLKWAINAIVSWDQDYIIDSIIHIHGIRDNIFPIRFIKEPILKIKGSHAIILTQANWFNKNLFELISD